MQELLSNMTVQVRDCIYLKDPESSDLGKRIVAGSIDLIDEIGFEGFTFRKLAKKIGSTEASIYRYFESKHKLLLYLTNWYWGWMEYKLVFGLANIKSPHERLERAILILTEQVSQDSSFSHVDEVKLDRIVISESSKAYLTKDVDKEGRQGMFSSYGKLVERVGRVIKEIEPGYKYAEMLVTTVVEGAHHQRFFADHLPELTSVVEGEDSITSFYKQLVKDALKK